MEISESVDDQMICWTAHRYCLDRDSYVVDGFIDWCKSGHWEQIREEGQALIVRDTVKKICGATASNQMPRANDWIDFVKWAWARLSAQQRSRVLYMCDSHYCDSTEWIKINLMEAGDATD